MVPKWNNQRKPTHAQFNVPTVQANSYMHYITAVNTGYDSYTRGVFKGVNK